MRLVRFIGWGGGGGGGGRNRRLPLSKAGSDPAKKCNTLIVRQVSSLLQRLATPYVVCVWKICIHTCVYQQKFVSACVCVWGGGGCMCVCVCMHECLHFCLFCEIISVLLLKEINLNVFAFKMFCQYFCFCASSPFQPCLQRGRLEICWKMEPVRLSHLHDHHSRFNRHLHRHRFFPQYHRLARRTQLLIRKWQSVVSDCVYC